MRRGHPLYEDAKLAERELRGLCDEYARYFDQSFHPPDYTFSFYQQRELKIFMNDLTDRVAFLIKREINNSVKKTLHLLEETYKIIVGPLERLDLEVKIEQELRKRFAGKTLNERLNFMKVHLTQKMLSTYRLGLTGILKPKQAFSEMRDVINSRGTWESVYGWNYRILLSEIPRAYHYTVQQFAIYTSARTIEVKLLDKSQWEDEEYRKLVKGSPYKPEELPDYPRPLASYLLELNY